MAAIALILLSGKYLTGHVSLVLIMELFIVLLKHLVVIGYAGHYTSYSGP